MALKSMTGFGVGSATGSGIRVAVELSSVNRRQLDIHVSLPRDLITLDARLQQIIRGEFSRGRISGIVRVEATDGSKGTVRTDQRLATAYVEEMRKTARKLKLTDDLNAESVCSLPGVMTVEHEEMNADHVSGVLSEAVTKALRGMARMRVAEGKVLEKDLRERIGLLDNLLKSIREAAQAVVSTYREKLFARLEEAGLQDLASDERVVKEIALYADRCDISEELTRLKSHLAQARRLLRSPGPVGRTLDFLCQELFREINTIGSKSGEVGITRFVVDFKTELERIREQVQNIE